MTQSPALLFKGREKGGGANDGNPESTKNDGLPQTLCLYICLHLFHSNRLFSAPNSSVPLQQLFLWWLYKTLGFLSNISLLAPNSIVPLQQIYLRRCAGHQGSSRQVVLSMVPHQCKGSSLSCSRCMLLIVFSCEGCWFLVVGVLCFNETSFSLKYLAAKSAS